MSNVVSAVAADCCAENYWIDYVNFIELRHKLISAWSVMCLRYRWVNKIRAFIAKSYGCHLWLRDGFTRAFNGLLIRFPHCFTFLLFQLFTDSKRSSTDAWTARSSLVNPFYLARSPPTTQSNDWSAIHCASATSQSWFMENDIT